MAIENQNMDQLFTELFGGDSSDTPQISIEEIVKRKESSYNQFMEMTRTSADEVSSRFYLHIFLKYASIACLIIGIACVFEFHGRYSVKNQLAIVKVESPACSTVKTTLPDGTQVWLNAGSSLSYSQAFGIDNRQVTLEGEGYFEVSHDAEKPFSVNSSSVNITVLGTKFNYRDYADDDIALVTLLEGSVRIQGNDVGAEKLILKPDQSYVLNKSTHVANIQNVKALVYKSWTTGRLVFDNERLEDIAQQLTHLYGRKVTINTPSLLDIRFYGEFALDEDNIESIIQGITSACDSHYRITNQEIVIY